MRPDARTVYTLRAATPDDISAVDALLSRSYPKLLKADYPPSVMVTAVPLISRAQPRLLASGTYYVIETDEGDVVAAGGWTRSRKYPRRGDIRHVVTDDRCLRRGLGRAIMEHCFDTARDAGVAEMECWATFTAVPFYTSVGFQKIGPISVPLAGGISFPAVRMTRRL